MNSEKDQLCEQTEQQSDPGLARGEDFELMSPEEARALEVPFNGSCGRTYSEYRRLLKEAGETSKGPITGKGAPRPIKNVSQGRPTKPVQR